MGTERNTPYMLPPQLCTAWGTRAWGRPKGNSGNIKKGNGQSYREAMGKGMEKGPQQVTSREGWATRVSGRTRGS